MMSEKKFKVGDRVRFIGDSGPWFEHQITSGDEGTVTGKGIYDNDVCVSFSIADVVDMSDLQVIEQTNPRTAFLQELKELLAKYDARIASGAKYEDSCWVEAYVGSELAASSEGKSIDFTADNIMNHE